MGLSAGRLRSDSAWHGFKNIDNEHMYLDPIKVTILTPGMKKTVRWMSSVFRQVWSPNISMNVASS